MKQTLAILFSIITLFSSINLKESDPKKYIPKALKSIKFGTSLTTLKEKRSLINNDESGYDFRHVYSETINKDGITEVAYYFDADGNKPLYELIVNFENEEIRDQVAEKLLGKPNYSEKEWKFQIKGKIPLYAWKFKNKIIYVVPYLGTEWNEKGVIDLE